LIFGEAAKYENKLYKHRHSSKCLPANRYISTFEKKKQV